jgi:hypothetical protein
MLGLMMGVATVIMMVLPGGVMVGHVADRRRRRSDNVRQQPPFDGGAFGGI